MNWRVGDEAQRTDDTSHPSRMNLDKAVTSDAPDRVPALDAWKITKTWQRGKLVVLSDLELTVQPGPAVFIGGRNGAGKTTLLRILCGLIGPDEGHVSAFGLDPFRNRRAFHRKVALLSSGNQGLYARLSVRQQIDTWARIAFVPPDKRGTRVRQVIEEFHLTELADRRSDRLSLGQRQRLRIALTFVAEPSLLLMDEPRTSLDSDADELLGDAVRRRVSKGAAVVWVSPTPDGVAFEFDAQYTLRDGRLVQE